MKYGKRFGGGGLEKRPGSKPKRALWASSYVARMSGQVRHFTACERCGLLVAAGPPCQTASDCLRRLEATQQKRSSS